MQPVKHEPAVVVASIAALTQRWAIHCAAAARAAQAARGRFALGVPGGSVAEHFLPALVAQEIDWQLVDLFFCDERCVPPRSEDSNFAAVERLLLAALGGGQPRVHRMPGEDPEPVRAARDYAATLRFVLGSPPVLDIALLGVGEDGHVASLFPARPALYAVDPSVLVEDAAPKPPPLRLTLSLDVLSGAREVIVAAFGPGKAAAVAEALQDPASELPLAWLLRRALRATVLLDEEAASGLGR
jgi:6-phosphogluconolactonase